MHTDVGSAAVFINGTVGSGKSTTAETVGQLLADREIPHAVIDLDALRRGWPAPAGDPFNNAVELENLAAVAEVYRRAGARRLVLAGVLEGPAMRAAYRAAVAMPLVVVRLRLDVAVVQQRLVERHVGDGEGLAWHLARSGELHNILESAGAEDAVVDTAGLERLQVARAVMDAAGWSQQAISDQSAER